MSDIKQAIQKLAQSIQGEVIVPGDKDYEAASTILFAKGTPAVVVRPLSADEVSKAIAFARKHRLVISVRSGGHSNAGHSTNQGGMVIDVTRLNAVEIVDTTRHIVRIGAGAIWVKVAKVLQLHGLAISSGDTKTVGVSGLALAGGIGWLVRKYGLTIDNVVGAELVTADGKVVHANKREHSDLFWAIRGGGGNFGVATSFDIVAHPIGDVYAGMVMYDLKELEPVLKGWRNHMRTAPEELNSMVVVMPPNPAFAGMPAAAIILICYGGDNEAKAMRAINPLLGLGKVLNKDIKRKQYQAVLEDAHPPQGVKIITNNVFVRECSDELIDVICKNSGQVLQIRSVGGAMNRVPADATAFPHRDSEVLIVAPTFVPPNATPSTIYNALAPWRAIEAYGNGAYVSFFSEDTAKELTAAYPPATYKRLAAIKKQYDPDNIFSKNYNIKPN